MRLWTTPEQRPTGFFQTKGVSNFFVQCSGAGALICGICECEDPHYGERYADGDPDDLGGKEVEERTLTLQPDLLIRCQCSGEGRAQDEEACRRPGKNMRN